MIFKAKSVKYIRIDGRTSSEQRNFFCREFQSKDDYRVAILSITAANAGLNLCAANLVVFAELFWNPGILVQAEDRVHRIGQADSVSVQYLVARGTADDYIWPLVQDKLNILSKAGLTRDDFSDASTKVMQTMDNSQSTILDLFRSDFIDDSPVIASCSIESLPESEMTASVQAETSKKTTVTNASSPVKKTSPGKKKTPIKFKGPRTELTPTKRQASLTDFFTSTPPKKILRLDDACGKAPEESPEDNAFTENSTQATADISQDDLVVLESVDWDDDL
ncbi:unnamed protein product [Lymnaea stagnalis]|uniref:Helicase C-terminal domain-containing protein n=1 Tax=Lymnaea stagnalis TaxID=6523 RepID=A0AAV2H0V8_LYMST